MTSTYCLFAGKYGSTPPTVSVKQKMDRCIEAHIRGRSRQLSVLMSNTDIQKRACQRQAESVTKNSGIKINKKNLFSCVVILSEQGTNLHLIPCVCVTCRYDG